MNDNIFTIFMCFIILFYTFWIDIGQGISLQKGPHTKTSKIAALK